MLCTIPARESLTTVHVSEHRVLFSGIGAQLGRCSTLSLFTDVREGVHQFLAVSI